MTLLGDGAAGNATTSTGSGGQGNSTGGSGGNNGQTGGGSTGSGGSTGTGSGATPTWRDTLPDDLKSSAALSPFSDVASLAKSYIHTKELVGKKGVIPPGNGATDEDWSNFYNQLGRPAVDKYELKAPQGKEVDEEFLGNFKQWAHDAGILPKQAQKLLDKYWEKAESTQQEQVQAVRTEGENQIKQLRTEWGDGYDKNVALARLAVKEVGGSDLGEYLNQTGLGNDVKLIKFMSKVGKLLGEDRIMGDGSGKFGQTPDELDGEIAKIRSNPLFGSHEASPAKQRLYQEYETLMRKRYS